jgi:hypothetical protein
MEKWQRFATDFDCPEDGYDSIFRQFGAFRRLLSDEDWRLLQKGDIQRDFQYAEACGLAHIRIKDGSASLLSSHSSTIEFVVKDMMRDVFGPLSSYLPDMDFLFNTMDAPAYLPHHPGVDYFGEPPSFTADKHDPYFLALLNSERCHDASISAKTMRHLHQYFHVGHRSPVLHRPFRTPILSHSSILNCFHDILFPTWHSRHKFPFSQKQMVPWDEKNNTLIWRGSLTGADLWDVELTKTSHRVRFITYGQNVMSWINKTNASMVPIDAAFTDSIIADENKKREIEQLFPPADVMTPQEQLKYKYIMMIDGWTFNERLYEFLSSGSLLFRAHIFDEWYEDMLKPWVHYVPVRFDLSDLSEKLLWARNHDEEARQISENARILSLRYLNPKFHKCYSMRMLLEYATHVEVVV